MKNTTLPFVENNNFKFPKNKTLTLFGIGPIATKTLDLYHNDKIKKIYDNAKNLWNEKYKNIKILNPKDINNKEDFIIITSTSYLEISKQLIKCNLKPYDDFIISPILNNIKIISELEQKKKTLIFTSGAPPQDNKEYGGGLYKLEIDGYIWKYEKILSGHCYDILKKNNEYFIVDEQKGIIKLNKNLKTEKIYAIDKNLRPHGLSYHNTTERFFLNCTEQDQINIYDKNFKYLEKIEISKKKQNTKIKQHHINDNLIVEDSLFVTMFSYSGNYLREVYDGVIAEYDILNLNEKPKIIKDNLWMPHSIKFFNKSLFVLNSLPGELMGYNFQVMGKFPAFTRGLAYDGDNFYIGQSKNRNFSKFIGISNFISIDTGIIMFDDQTKLSRFFQLDPRISEVHSIEVIN